MLLPTRKELSLKGAIDARLRVAHAMRTVQPMTQPENIAGLFLVKAGTAFPGNLPAPAKAGRSELRKSRLNNGNQTFSRELAQSQTGHEWLLGVMAAAGPLVWFGHALLIWLKAR